MKEYFEFLAWGFKPEIKRHDVFALLWRSEDALCRPRAKYCFNPLSRLSRATRAGTLASPATASKIATQQISPTTREPWTESVAASVEGLPPRRMQPVAGGRAGRGAPGRGERGRQGTKRGPPLGGAEGNNYRRTGGFGNLPGADMDYSAWTVEQLREFLSVSKP